MYSSNTSSTTHRYKYNPIRKPRKPYKSQGYQSLFKKPCSIQGCPNLAYKKGLCKLHTEQGLNALVGENKQNNRITNLNSPRNDSNHYPTNHIPNPSEPHRGATRSEEGYMRPEQCDKEQLRPSGYVTHKEYTGQYTRPRDYFGEGKRHTIRPKKHFGQGKIIEQDSSSDANRPSANDRGYTYQWHKERKKFLAENPWCSECLKQGIYTPATEVDHVIPHKGNQELFWDRNNWDSKCKSCHSRKTRLEDMGAWY